MPNTTRKTGLSKHAATFHGLHEWHKNLFEKMGWMVLAKEKGYDYKIADYKKSINRLMESLKHVMGEYTDLDSKHDLKVLMTHVECLKAFVAKHF
jgi:hypothetical protein